MSNQKTVLQRALEWMYEEGEIDIPPRNYSGRGMFGKECVSIEGSPDLHMAAVMTQVVLDKWPDEIGDFVNQIDQTRTDSLGLGQITYWPGVPYVED